MDGKDKQPILPEQKEKPAEEIAGISSSDHGVDESEKDDKEGAQLPLKEEPSLADQIKQQTEAHIEERKKQESREERYQSIIRKKNL